MRILEPDLTAVKEMQETTILQKKTQKTKRDFFFLGGGDLLELKRVDR